MEISSLNAGLDATGSHGDAPSPGDAPRAAPLPLLSETALISGQLELAEQRERLAEDRGRIEAERGRLAGERAVLNAAAADSKRQRRRPGAQDPPLASRRATGLGATPAPTTTARSAACPAWRTIGGGSPVRAGPDPRLGVSIELVCARRSKSAAFELGQLRQRVRQLESAAADHARALAAVEQARDQLASDLQRRAGEFGDESQQLQNLRADRMSLHARLTAAEQELADRSQLEAELEQKLADAQRRFELRIPDDILAQKDREIAELKQVLDHQSSSLGSLAVGATAIADLFEGDELIRHEREKLREMQHDWHEKMRGAEIEISLERAKLARDRAVLEELEARHPTPPVAPPLDGQAEFVPKKSSRGRWLARLGLKDAAEQSPGRLIAARRRHNWSGNRSRVGSAVRTDTSESVTNWSAERTLR